MKNVLIKLSEETEMLYRTISGLNHNFYVINVDHNYAIIPLKNLTKE